MRALLTRPSEDAERTAAALSARGIETIFEPMLEIVPIAGATVDLAGVQAILFSSANAVRVLARATERRDTPVFTVGDASAEATRGAGFRRIENAKGDVDALARLVVERLDPRDGALLYASGSAIAGDLADRLATAGFTVRRAILYDAVTAKALSAETILQLREGRVDIALFFSPRSAETFVSLARRASVAGACRDVVAICLSPAVGDAVRAVDWKAIRIAERPEANALMTAIDMAGREREMGVQQSSKEPDGAPAAAKSATASRKRRRAPVAVWLIALIAVLGVGAWATWPQWRDPLLARLGIAAGPDADQALERRIDAQAAEQRALAGRMDQATAALARRLADAERSLAQHSADAAARAPETARALKSLEERITALESRFLAPPQPAATTSEIQPPTSDPRVESMALALREAAQRLARLELALAGAQPGPRPAEETGALMLAAAQLGNALATPGPFATELAVLRRLGENDPGIAEALAPLAPYAERGIATREALARRFEAVAADLARSELVVEDGDLFDRALARLAGIVSIRRTGEIPGTSPGAVSARAETRLKQGDLVGAVAAVAALTGRPAGIAAPWLAEARSRLLADQALAQLTARTLERAAGAPPGRSGPGGG